MNSKVFGRGFFIGTKVLIFLVLNAFLLNLNAAQIDAGKTIVAKGTVVAKINAQKRQLSRRSPVYLADTIETGESSRTQMRMIDGGLLALQSDSSLAITTYEFDSASLDGGVAMRLIKGGLRTITGQLRQSGNNYILQTPVASIGVRGTHYEAELLDGDLHLAVWAGVIEVDVEIGKNQRFLLGDAQNYRYAIVSKDGTVTFLLRNALVFASGHSDEMTDIAINQTAPTINAGTLQVEHEDKRVTDFTMLSTLESPLDNNVQVASYLLDETAIAGRSGQVSFDVVEQFSAVGNAGAISDFQMSLDINFDTATVPTGNLSFNDDAGEWFAVFNGVLQTDTLDVNINFASHNNQLADGFLNGILIDDASAVLGHFELFEVNNDTNRAQGTFLVRDNQP